MEAAGSAVAPEAAPRGGRRWGAGSGGARAERSGAARERGGLAGLGAGSGPEPRRCGRGRWGPGRSRGAANLRAERPKPLCSGWAASRSVEGLLVKGKTKRIAGCAGSDDIDPGLQSGALRAMKAWCSGKVRADVCAACRWEPSSVRKCLLSLAGREARCPSRACGTCLNKQACRT